MSIEKLSLVFSYTLTRAVTHSLKVNQPNQEWFYASPVVNNVCQRGQTLNYAAILDLAESTDYTDVEQTHSRR